MGSTTGGVGGSRVVSCSVAPSCRQVPWRILHSFPNGRPGITPSFSGENGWMGLSVDVLTALFLSLSGPAAGRRPHLQSVSPYTESALLRHAHAISMAISSRLALWEQKESGSRLPVAAWHAEWWHLSGPREHCLTLLMVSHRPCRLPPRLLSCLAWVASLLGSAFPL